MTSWIILVALTWPATARLDDRACFASRLAFALALSIICALLGTAATLPAQSRVLTSLSPLVPALALWLLFRKVPEPAPFRRADFLFLSMLAVFVSMAVVWALRCTRYSYDGLLYHLPAAALAWQQGTLFVATAHPQIGTNPVLPEMLKVWTFAITGTDGLSALHQLPAAAALAAFACSLSRRWGAGGTFSALAAAAVLLVPKVAEQAISQNLDLLAALAGTASAVLLARRRIVPAALALFFFAQIKYSTLLPASAGSIFLFVHFLRNRRFKIAIAWALLFATAGGFWEWHNWAVRGNPLHPYQVLVGEGNPLARLAPGWLIERPSPEKWPGYYVNEIERAAGGGFSLVAPVRYFLAWSDSLYVPYDRYSARWGPAWFILGVPALALFLIWRRRKAPRELMFALLFYFLTVKSWEARFGFVLLPFGFAAAAFLLELTVRTIGSRALPTAGVAALLGWCAVQVALSHPNPAIWRNPGLGGLAISTLDPAAIDVESLAETLHRLAPRSLWIDFTHGERHSYGMASTLLYPYFSRKWDRRVEIRSAQELGVPAAEAEIRAEAPEMILLQSGSGVSAERLGYRLVASNREGALYARR